MKKLYITAAVATFLLSSMTMASGMKSARDPACQAVANACKTAGYARHSDKNFWFNCMHPLLLGTTVKNVSIPASQVKACRANKIVELQKELQQLQAVK